VAARKRSNEEEGKGNRQRGSEGVVHECKIKNIHITGPMVQSEALAATISFGNDQFKASTGRLDSFKKRHDTVWNGVKEIKAEAVKKIFC
jgi:hypothetical protein